MASGDTSSCPMASSDDPGSNTCSRYRVNTTGATDDDGAARDRQGCIHVQSLTPVKQMSQHVCTFALYSHDMSRQIETHHYITRGPGSTRTFSSAPVYDSEHSKARLIGIEYIISNRLFEALPHDEQKLWHSHAYENKSGLCVNPRIPEMIGKPELGNLAKTYGDRLPLGAPALMMSPQGVSLGKIDPELVKKRDDKYNISTEAIQESKVEIEEPEWINPQADYWKQHGKCFAIDIEPTEMKLRAPFP